jgi:hypothetical protein
MGYTMSISWEYVEAIYLSAIKRGWLGNPKLNGGL